MATIPYRQRPVAEKRRDNIERIEQMTVQITDYFGHVLIVHDANTTTGEATVDIEFPVVFTEKPVFTYGGELDKNHRATAGSYPEITAVVVDWNTVGAIEGVTEGRYVGATVDTVTKGQANQNILLHYSFKGKAMRNPLKEIKEIGLL